MSSFVFTLNLPNISQIMCSNQMEIYWEMDNQAFYKGSV